MSRFLSLSRPLNRLAVAHRTRNFHLSPRPRNNGRSGGGLTNILAGEVPPPVQVKSVSSAGIHLQDGLLLSSSCIFLEGKVFLWDVPPTLWQGWSKERFELFELVVPKPGGWKCRASHAPTQRCTSFSYRNPLTGNGRDRVSASCALETVSWLTRDTDRSYEHCRSFHQSKRAPGLNVREQWNACTTYNLLAEEGRRVAAALLPFTPRPWKG